MATAALGNDGVRLRPTLVDSISDAYGRTLRSWDPVVVRRAGDAHRYERTLGETCPGEPRERHGFQPVKIVGGKLHIDGRAAPADLGPEGQ